MFRKISLLIALVASISIVPIARSDDKPKDQAKPAAAGAADPAAMAAEYEKMAQPGPEHAKLKEFAGDWDAACKFWNPDGSEGSPSKGVMHGKMILGDRYLQLHYEGQMDMGNGMKPFKGMGISGYDKGKKKYVNIWIDEMSTGMMTTEGTCEGKTMTAEGSCTNPMSGQPMKIKEVTTDVDKDHHNYELWMSGDDGKLMKVMEIAYTRKV